MPHDFKPLKKLLELIELPSFLVLNSKGKFKVIGLNDKLKGNSFEEKKNNEEESLEKFLTAALRLDSKLVSEFIGKLNEIIDSKLFDASYSVKLPANHQILNFNFSLLDYKDQSFAFISLKYNSEEVKKPETLKIESFKTIFESLPIGIAVNTIDDNKSVYFNEKFYDIYGWSQKDIPDVDTYLLKAYPDAAYRKEIYEKVIGGIASGNPKKMSWPGIRIMTKAGEKKIITATNIPLHQQNLMISTVVDTTDSYNAQKKLQLAKNRFDLAARATSDAVWEWNLSEDELYWGDGYKRLFGYNSKNNMVSRDFWESKIHPNDLKPFFDSLQEALDDKTLSKWTFDYRFQNLEGNYANVRENIVIVRNVSGDPIRLVGALQDITKPLKRENHLNLLEKLIDGTNDAILVTEVKSDSFLESEIVYANSSFQNLFGFKISEIIGSTPRDIYLSIKNEDDFEKLDDKLSHWESVNVDVISLTQNQLEFWNNLSITPIFDDQGWYTHWMIVNRNVNDLKTNAEKSELLTFTHQAFQGGEYLESIFCKISLKIEDLVRSHICQFWLLNHYSKDLSKFLELRDGKLVNIKSEISNFNSEDFAMDIFNSGSSSFKIHKEESDSESEIKTSFGFEIKSHGECLGVVILSFKDTYSREETLRSIFDEFSIQLANEISRKRTEKEMQAFFEYTPDLMCKAEKENLLTKVSKRTCEHLGYTEKEMLSISYLTFVKEEDREKAKALLDTARNNEGNHSSELQIVTKNAQILRIEWTAFSLENSDDIFCIGRDVTALKENLSNINTEIEKFRIIAETVKDAVWDFDLVTEKMSWGFGLKKLFGYDPDDFGVAEEVWLEKIHPKDRKRVKTSFDSVLQNMNKKEWIDEYKFRKKDGSYANVYDRGKIIKDESGKPIKMVGSMQDISEFRQYENLLESLNRRLILKTESLSKSNKDLEEFAYIASHDLQEPLRMVTGFLTRLEQKYAGKLDEKAQEYINFAVDGAKRMRQIINGLLNFSKVGRNDLPLSKVDVNSVIKDVEILLHEAIEAKGAKIEVGKLPVIDTVEDELKEVFLNLIDNSIKYSRPDSLPKIKIDYEELKKHHLFSVEDNGLGISKEYFNKIFRIFQRLHGQSEYSGTGIGLAIVEKIITNFKGEVSVESELGKGSKFLIKLPKKSIDNEKPSDS